MICRYVLPVCSLSLQPLCRRYRAKAFNFGEVEFSSLSFFFFNILNDLFIVFYFLAGVCGMQDLSSLTRDRTCAPFIGSAES